MQRCPYIHEMRERLLGQNNESLALGTLDREELIENQQNIMDNNQVGTVVKVGAKTRK